jgi:hypothetical protein
MCSLQQAIAVVDRVSGVRRYWRQIFDVNKYSRPGDCDRVMVESGQAYKSQ